MRIQKPSSCRAKKSCQPTPILDRERDEDLEEDSPPGYLTIQMTSVLTLSRTILVVALSSLVMLIPAKLKKAIEMIVPEKARASRGL